MTQRIIPILAADDSASVVSLYASDNKIYARSVEGLFATWRWAMVWVTQLVFYGLPWLSLNDRPLVLFDLGARRFYIFSLVFYPQDLIYLTGLLIISALSLFLFTAVAGRLWCGYACPQTVYTEIFMWVERMLEGDRNARMRRDNAAWDAGKVARKLAKHSAWMAIALWTGFTFVGYFTPIRDLAHEVAVFALGPWELFWVLFYGFATYGNAGWMREQVCKYMCPYARFQSAMFDRDTLIVTYDANRGESRGARPRSNSPEQYRAKGLGDCVDCGLCVQVCPTGIDIRKGLQYECIACSSCIDACDGVMDKMNYPRGLIRNTTQNALALNLSSAQSLRRVLRPRVLVYCMVLMALVGAMCWSLLIRPTFKVDVVRDRGVAARMVGHGLMENVYRLQIMNATEYVQRYSIAVAGIAGARVVSEPVLEVDGARARWAAVRVQIPPGAGSPGSTPINFVVSAQTEPTQKQHVVTEKSVFLVPR